MREAAAAAKDAATGWDAFAILAIDTAIAAGLVLLLLPGLLLSIIDGLLLVDVTLVGMRDADADADDPDLKVGGMERASCQGNGSGSVGGGFQRTPSRMFSAMAISPTSAFSGTATGEKRVRFSTGGASTGSATTSYPPPTRSQRGLLGLFAWPLGLIASSLTMASHSSASAVGWKNG